MNRFVKDNLILVISIGLTAVVALALLIYGIIEWVHIDSLMDETEKLRGKISSIIRVKPAPVDGNKEPITKDTQEYVKLYKSISGVFDTPMRPARNAFLKVLYNMKDGDDYEEKAREFLDKYNERVKSDAPVVEQRMAWERLRLEFKNWDAAVAAFCKASAGDPFLNLNSTAESLEVEQAFIPSYRNDTVLQELNILRNPGEDKEISGFLHNVRTYLESRLGDRLNTLEGNSSSDRSLYHFGFSASGDSSGEGAKTGYTKADFPIIARHAAILCDVIGRIADSKVENFNGIAIRGATPEGLGSSFTEENGCHIAHYTFMVHGSLDSIRELAASFDRARQDKRFYIVRSVFLYEDKTAKSIKTLLASESDESKAQSSNEQVSQESGGLFGGGRRARLARQRKAEEEQRESEQERMRKAEEEEIRKKEASLEPHERTGYADPVVEGGTSIKAIFDIDYIERR
ncbi:MAG: hypothetical protein J6S24_10205 [Lentisphaeria bacterium]|nr:hypothetical protein [Lentisphaeria bacterium]MBO7152665.1 hypothetical protein [Lentisphaeria bacterium]